MEVGSKGYKYESTQRPAEKIIQIKGSEIVSTVSYWEEMESFVMKARVGC